MDPKTKYLLICLIFTSACKGSLFGAEPKSKNVSLTERPLWTPLSGLRGSGYSSKNDNLRYLEKGLPLHSDPNSPWILPFNQPGLIEYKDHMFGDHQNFPFKSKKNHQKHTEDDSFFTHDNQKDSRKIHLPNQRYLRSQESFSNLLNPKQEFESKPQMPHFQPKQFSLNIFSEDFNEILPDHRHPTIRNRIYENKLTKNLEPWKLSNMDFMEDQPIKRLHRNGNWIPKNQFINNINENNYKVQNDRRRTPETPYERLQKEIDNTQNNYFKKPFNILEESDKNSIKHLSNQRSFPITDVSHKSFLPYLQNRQAPLFLNTFTSGNEIETPDYNQFTYNLKPKITPFYGRKVELTKIRLLHSQDKPVILSGQPKIGKSVITNHYANYFKENGGNVIWIDCTNFITMYEDLIDIAKELNMEKNNWDNPHYIIRQIFYIFKDSDTLIIFDNAMPTNHFITTLNVYVDFNNQVKVLITSPVSSEWDENIFSIIPIRPFWDIHDLDERKQFTHMNKLNRVKKYYQGPTIENLMKNIWFRP